jgi:hypothetical protein
MIFSGVALIKTKLHPSEWLADDHSNRFSA